MSLESAIQENTAVLRELIARLGTSSPTAVTMSGSEYVAQLEETPAILKPQVDVVAAVKPVETKTEPKVITVDYNKEVKPLLLKVSASKGRDALVSLLNKFGVTKGDQLPAGKLPQVVTEVNELLAA